MNLINKKYPVKVHASKKKVVVKIKPQSELSKVKLEFEGEKLNRSALNRELNRSLGELSLWARIKKWLKK